MNGTLTPEILIEFVAPLMRTTPERIVSKISAEPECSARNVCAYLMYEHLPSITYREIAEILGWANHGSTYYSVRRVRGFLDTGCLQTTRIVRYVEENLVRSTTSVDPNQTAFAWMLTPGEAR